MNHLFVILTNTAGVDRNWRGERTVQLNDKSSCYTTIQSVRRGSDTSNKNRERGDGLFQSREVK